MNNIALWIYLIGLVDALGGALTFLFAGLGITAILSLFAMIAITEPYTKEETKFVAAFGDKFRPTCIGLLVVMVIGVLMPSSKTLTAMIVVPAVVENQRLQNIGDNGLKLIEQKMAKWLKEQAERSGE